ncbi:hypothetical protein Hanom_Chr05g00429451 [Helianthus anomalus]
MFSEMIMNDMLVELGYSGEDVVIYHFRVPGEDLRVGFGPLGNESDIIRLLKYVETNKLLEVYIQHVHKHPKKDVETDEEDEGEHEPEYVDLSDEDSDEQDKENDSDSVGGSYDPSDLEDKGTASEEGKASKHVNSKARKHGTDKVGQDKDEDSDYMVDKIT